MQDSHISSFLNRNSGQVVVVYDYFKEKHSICTWNIYNFDYLCQYVGISNNIISDKFETFSAGNNIGMLWYAFIRILDIKNRKLELGLIPIQGVDEDMERNYHWSVHIRCISNEGDIDGVTTFDNNVVYENINYANAIKCTRHTISNEISDLGENSSKNWGVSIEIKIWSTKIRIENKCNSCKLYKKRSSGFDKYFHTKDFSDIIFTFEDKSVLKAHKLILSSQCEYFAKMFEGTWKESLATSIPVNDISYISFRAQLYYLYTGRLDESFPPNLLGELYTEAHIKEIKGLLALCISAMLEEMCIDTWYEFFKIGIKYTERILVISACRFASKLG